MKASDDERLPVWAIREIRSLSKRTGISFQKILKTVLGFGIYHAKEQLETVANLLESAEQMACISPSNKLNQSSEPEPEHQSDESITVPESADTVGTEESIDRPNDQEALATELSGYVRSDPVTARYLDASERRTEHQTNGSDSDYASALSGE